MSKVINKTKSPQALAARQPQTAHMTISQPPSIYVAPRSEPSAAAPPTHEEIARRAYQIYVQKGRPKDQSEQIWRQAEQELLSPGRLRF